MSKRLATALSFTGLLLACGGGGDKTTGIEIGNPTLAQGVSTRFLVDYGEPAYPFLARTGLVPSADEPLVVDSLKLELMQVRHRSSYYIQVGTEYPDGIVIWSHEGRTEPYAIIFSAEGNQSLPALGVGPMGYLKEMGYSFQSPVGPAITGSYRNTSGDILPFEFHLPRTWTVDFFYHRSQLTLGPGGRYGLDMHFHVPDWAKLCDWDSLAVDENGVIQISPGVNSAAWDALARGLPTAFDALRYSLVTGNPPDTTTALHPVAVSRMNALGMQRVRNNIFENNAEDWIFQVQFGGVASYSVVDGGLRIAVTQGGSYDYSVQLIQEDFSILKDSCYQLEFEARSDVEGIIGVRMGQYHYPYSGLATPFAPRITTQATWYEHWVRPRETNPFARIEFNIGRRARVIYLRGVRFTQRLCNEMP